MVRTKRKATGANPCLLLLSYLSLISILASSALATFSKKRRQLFKTIETKNIDGAIQYIERLIRILREPAGESSSMANKHPMLTITNASYY
ncbi:hypothetical protein SDD30_02330 [Moorella naiadis]